MEVTEYKNQIIKVITDNENELWFKKEADNSISMLSDINNNKYDITNNDFHMNIYTRAINQLKKRNKS